MKRAESILICLLFAGLLLAPALAWLSGMRASEFENRTLAELPAFAPASLASSSYYSELSSWMEDHLSLRHQAVHLNARIALEILDDSPDPQVWLGRGQWLFLDDGLRMACSGDAPADALLSAVARVGQMLHESGRELRWMIVPNKIALYPEYATGRVLRAATCGEARRADLFATMQRRTPAGFINLHAAFGAAKQRYDHPLYFADDSHITEFGSGLLLQQLVVSLQPGIWDSRSMRQGRNTQRSGDLARMLVARGSIEVETWAVIRPGVGPGPTTTRELATGVNRREFTTTGPDSMLITQPAFILHDSQFNTAMAMTRTCFARSTFIPWKGFEAQRIAREMAAAQIVVIEVIERDFYWRIAGQLGSGEFIAALERELGAGRAAD